MELKFRKLRADEIDVRIGSTKSPKGTSLLLYKDARCDMNILDETVGSMGWERKHTRDNANCIVSIWDTEKNQWVSKEDTGTESFTEKEKGLASDSFKRACFNWGIGRELYTGGFIFIPISKISKEDVKYARFEVKEVTYDEHGNIEKLKITVDDKVVFDKNVPTKKEEPKEAPKEKPKTKKATQKQVDELVGLLSSEDLLKAKKFFLNKGIEKLEDVEYSIIQKMIDNATV